MGLRERKKARTRSAIQDHALRLFIEQGYDATTVEQIAEAAEVSPSTFFRYFPAKEDVVAYDRLDPELMRAFVAQPPEYGLVMATRAAVQEVFGGLDRTQGKLEQARGQLLTQVPALRARMGDGLLAGIDMFAEAIAKRTGRPADSDEVRATAGALAGAMVAVFVASLGRGPVDFVDSVDRALDQLDLDLSASPPPGKAGATDRPDAAGKRHRRA